MSFVKEIKAIGRVSARERGFFDESTGNFYTAFIPCCKINGKMIAFGENGSAIKCESREEAIIIAKKWKAELKELIT